ncbi:MAG: alpha-L-rhamnosidase [Lentisphaeria bacterium]|nr:alpha-L-rhamnosidase [Lentisphaeria bacterium]
MTFHPDGIPDKRRRWYIPCRRILRAEGVENAERLVGNTAYQPVIHYVPPRVTIRPGGSLLLDFGRAFHGGVKLDPFEKPGRVRIKFGESVSEALGPSNQDCSRKDALLDLPVCGSLEYGNTVFRFVEIINEGETVIQCLNIMGVALERDLEVTGSFESSDPRLDEIWKTAVRTVHLCMQDYIYDGAKRDRIVWMGDLHPEIRGILCAFSDHGIIRDSLEFLMAQAGPEEPMNGFSTYSCWFVIALWDYCRAAGDREFLLKHAGYAEKMLRVFSRFIDDRGAEAVPGRRFLDWPNEDSPAAKHAGIHALLFWMMRSGAELLAAAGCDPAPCLEAMAKLRCHAPDPAGRKAPAALLTLTGLADHTSVLETDPFHGVSTFYGYYMLLAKKTVPALELIRRYWGRMLDFGATSFWEDFDLDWTRNAGRIDELPVPGKKDLHADFGAYCYKGLRHSLSHGWSCGPAPFLSERVLGVSFPEPGKVIVRPDLGDLTWVRGSVPAPGGVVTVEADAKGFRCDLPPGLVRIG